MRRFSTVLFMNDSNEKSTQHACTSMCFSGRYFSIVSREKNSQACQIRIILAVMLSGFDMNGDVIKIVSNE